MGEHVHHAVAGDRCHADRRDGSDGVVHDPSEERVDVAEIPRDEERHDLAPPVGQGAVAHRHALLQQES